MPGSIDLNATELEDTPANRAATKTVMRQWERNRSRLLQDFQDRGYDVLPVEWITASNIMTANLRLTVEQLNELTDNFGSFIDDQLARYRGQNLPGSRPVQIHFNAFPVIDGEETTTP